jgi:hypothetical protein
MIFTASGGLLTTEFGSLSTVVNDMLLAQPPLKDVRCMTREEISQEWVFDRMIKLWKQSLAYIKKFDRIDFQVSVF